VKPRWVALAGIVLALGVGGCGGGGDGEPATLSVYVSAPLQGPRAAAGAAIEDGARLALADAGGRVGKLRVRAVYMNDSGPGGWTIARAAANARRATEDSSSIGYLGDLDSGATRASLPITNQAEIVQISPGSTAIDLTRLPPVGNADPDRYRPGDHETFARLVPADDIQARAAALWADKRGAKTFAAPADQSVFGRTMSEEFASEARDLGLSPFSEGDIRRRFPDGRPDAIFLGTVPGARGVSLRMIARLSAGSEVFGSDALLDPAFLQEATATPLADRLHLTSPFLDPSLLPSEGQRFLRAYRRRFGRPADPAAAYGYESMGLLLDAIRRAGGDGDDRGAVADEVLSTQDRRSVLGTYSIDGNGDTTLDEVSGYRVSDGLPVFPVELTAPR
jgi:branched-chain amino acid transport system substrate-binding protein